MPLTYRVLGPFEIRQDGTPVRLAGPKLRVVLASLLVRAGHSVPLDELADRLWGEHRVRGEKQAIQTYVMRLRDRLGQDTIVTSPHGYSVDAGPGSLDLADAADLTRRADTAVAHGDDATAARLLREAEALWRGTPLAGVPSESLHREVVPRLVEAHLARVERRIALDIALDPTRDTVTELRGLTAEHPFRESFWALLMRALYATGRQADALAAYREISTRLGEELGLDPGPELRRVHQEVLTGTLPQPVARVDVRAAPARVPHELPARVGTFVGRATEAERVRGWLEATAPLVVISGGPGVGKSALATQCAHEVADRFPDGQLYLDLRGYSAATPAPVEEALGRLLRGLGTPGERVPPGLDDQVAAYRSLLAGRRVLVVVDNAVTAEQVRPLVPGEPGCAVLVTSRNQLRGLVARDGARLLPLDTLPATDAERLLAGLVGDDRITAETSAATRLVRACGALPLALRIAGANLAGRPHTSVAGYVDELTAHGALDRLRAGDDDTTAVAAAFDVSYDALTPPSRRLFRLLGLVPGPDFTLPAAEVLDGTDGRDGRDGRDGTAARLDALVSASLVQPYADGRYRLHDLVRAFAARRAGIEDGAAACAAARERLFRWYLRMVDAAIVPHRPELTRLAREAPDEGVFADGAAGVAWIDGELPNLAAAVDAAARNGPYELSWHLTDALRGYFIAAGSGAEAAAMLAAAREAADRHGDHMARAAMHGTEGSLRLGTADYPGAIASLDRAAEQYRLAGEVWGEIASLNNAGIAYARICRFTEAIACRERALELMRRHGIRRGLATVLDNLVSEYQSTGRLDEARRLLDDTAPGQRGDLESATYHGHRAMLAGLTGDVEATRAEGTTALRLCAELGEREKTGIVACELARFEASWGELDRAVSYAEDALRAATAAADRESELDARLTLAVLDARRGGRADPAALVALGAEIADLGVPTLETRHGCCLAWAQAEAGDPAAARAIAERTAATAERQELRYWQGDALAALATAQLALGDAAGAVRTGDRALSLCRRCGYGPLVGRVLVPLAEAHATGGDHAAAQRCRAELTALRVRYPRWSEVSPLGGV